jgi:hypothetical protein
MTPILFYFLDFIFWLYDLFKSVLIKFWDLKFRYKLLILLIILFLFKSLRFFILKIIVDLVYLFL